MNAKSLPPDQLRRRCDPESLGFATTADLVDLEGVLGQPRAVAAIEFGIGIEREGYNVFALGPIGAGKLGVVRGFLEAQAKTEPVPPDLCYVHNFAEENQPNLLALPAGRGTGLKRDMERLVGELVTALSGAFEGEEYQNRRQALEEQFREHQTHAFGELQQRAKERGLATLRTPLGVAFAPVVDDEVVPPDEFDKLPPERREAVQQEIAALQGDLQKVLRQVPRWQREHRERLRELNRQVIRFSVEPLFEELSRSYADVAEVADYLAGVEQDVAENAKELMAREIPEATGAAGAPRPHGPGLDGDPFLRRYSVNLLVDHAKSAAAPVVYEDHPTLPSLLGRVEHLSQMGALVTDFTLIKAGALHRAHGGYLMLEADKLLSQPYAWEALKRTLRSGQVKIESVGQALSLVSTVSLEPEPLALDVKVVLLGEPLLYYLLAYYDSEFERLFKVAADFDDRFPRDPDHERLYARLIATLARTEGLRPFDREAVAALVEQSAREAGDGEKLSAETSPLLDLLREADFWAGRAGRTAVAASDVARAIDARIFRVNRFEERMREEMLRETLRIETDGARVGQINGLSVLQLGGYAFGQPSRISARVRLGQGEVVAIEREVKLSGPIHSKGVLILSSYLAAHYAADRPLSLTASLVFEQSYGGIDGDSASSTELYALLSAISGLPLRQDLAVTGSVDQFGEVQAIGGVNEKIEGFFRLCQARGLTGRQGVLIPAANVKHLMLRREVVEAAAAGTFHVIPVAHVDQGIELLTGVPAGARDPEGTYPAGSVNARVEARLAELAARRQEYGAAGATGERRPAEQAPPPPAPPGPPPGPGGSGGEGGSGGRP